MMDITNSRDGASALEYFKNGLRREGNYYMEETPAYWDGETSKHPELNLYGKKVTTEDFRDLIFNVNPNTKEQLKPLNKSNLRCGFDVGAAPPKSVSILNALTQDEDLFKAHEYANRMMMQAIQRDVQAQANTQYGRFYETTSSMLWAPFHHFTSRPVALKKDGKTLYVPDMQMHTHNYCINVTRSLKRDKFLALEMGNIYRLAPYYQAIYHSYLSNRLNKIGYRVERTKDAYEIVGVSRSLIERFSNRRLEIQAIAKELGITDQKELARLSTLTRNSKGKAVDSKELLGLWKDRMSKEEFEGLSQIKKKYRNDVEPISAKDAVQRSLDHFLERTSTVPEKRVLGYGLELGYGTLLPDDVHRAMNEREDILRSEDHTISTITTREMVKAEDKMITLATRGKGKFKPINPEHTIKREFLNQGQREAVQVALSSPDFVTGIQGNAGSGKTTLLMEIAEATKASNRAFLSIAPSSQAVEVLRREGFDAHTVAAFMVNPKLQENITNGVLLFDEAGLSGVKSKTKVLSIAKAQNAQVLLSGDTKQHGSPGEYGDAFRILQQEAKIRTAHVKENMRQKPQEYRKAVDQIANGRVLEGYQTLSRMKAIHEYPEREERLARIASEYVSSVQAGRSALIVSPTHKDGNQISAMVREKLKSQGKITGKERTFDTLKGLSLTDSQKMDVVNYQEGQVVRFTKNQKGGFKAGSHYEVLAKEKPDLVQVIDLNSKQKYELPYATPQHYKVYQKTKIDLAVGDLIRPSENLKSKEHTKINNGTPQRVAGFSGGDIRLANGKTLAKDAFHFRHGYVDTSHSSQGKTADDVFISMSDTSFAGVNEQAFYVGVSRGRKRINLFTSDKQQLKSAITRSGQQTTAKAVAKDHERRMLERKQRAFQDQLTKTTEQHVLSRQKPKEVARDLSGQLQRS
ncbi:MAG: MobF family relaxase [Balneolaceae bacterium]